MCGQRIVDVLKRKGLRRKGAEGGVVLRKEKDCGRWDAHRKNTSRPLSITNPEKKRIATHPNISRRTVQRH